MCSLSLPVNQYCGVCPFGFCVDEVPIWWSNCSHYFPIASVAQTNQPSFFKMMFFTAQTHQTLLITANVLWL